MTLLSLSELSGDLIQWHYQTTNESNGKWAEWVGSPLSQDGSELSKPHLPVTCSERLAVSLLPGEAHEDRTVALVLSHIPLHFSTLVQKQGIGSAAVRGEDGLVGVGLGVEGDMRHEGAYETSGVSSPMSTRLAPSTDTTHVTCLCQTKAWLEVLASLQ